LLKASLTVRLSNCEKGSSS